MGPRIGLDDLEKIILPLPILDVSDHAVNQSHYRPRATRGFHEVKGHRLRDSDPEWW